ncbi:MerR family transcriptional regulator [Cupriavidus sp. USMAA2-4]|uniref:MerR family transcriptional regulator n=1 Tax=Cupriavidus malaysiensis TaxID=367825 RepID=A0ABN4THW3_9BURK|nr:MULTISPECIES: MerR family transcriptional regulator [Cupriavidus]AOY93658.1 MerR family transcriptional regulator [Cupriavidus sp. USMAA2-4]AOZ00064.1 MerR family transcriptional regulator [Cupriavidus sp. USMAHM13]AOZ06808.1 MerR family transcriptional regulator [Cupriavidus malaysiensis]
MSDKPSDRVALPPIPAKRYFTIGEVSELCAVKPHVLRYWEQEFTQLKPVKRRGNRRYYQHHEVLLIRRIRELLYEQGFTINGARNRLDEGRHHTIPPVQEESVGAAPAHVEDAPVLSVDLNALRNELVDVQHLLAQLREIAGHGPK